MKENIQKYKKFIIAASVLFVVIPLILWFISLRQAPSESIEKRLSKSNVSLPQDVQMKKVSQGIIQAVDKNGQTYIQMDKGVKVTAKDCVLPNNKTVSIVIPETENNAFPSFEETCKKLQNTPSSQ